jgi:hypothetical protein
MRASASTHTHTHKTTRFFYKDQSFTSVQGNNHCFAENNMKP